MCVVKLAKYFIRYNYDRVIYLKFNFEHRYVILGSSGAWRKVTACHVVHFDCFFRRCETCRKVCRGLEVQLGLEVPTDGIEDCSEDRANDEERPVPWAPRTGQMFVDCGGEHTAATLTGFSHQEDDEVR